MKKIITILSISIVLFSCSKKENSSNVDDLIASKNTKALLDKKAILQEDLLKINNALSKLNLKNDEALVAIKTIVDTTFNHYIEIQGNVDTKQNILIQPEFSGTLTTLTVKAGDRVSKGQILARVDDAGMSQQLANMESQFALAKTTFERQKNLWDKKIGSEIQYLQAQTQMVSAQKAVAQIKSQLSKTIIRAPFTGTIDEVFVEKGEVVAPSMQGLMRIVNLGNMFVSTTVPETYIGKLKTGTDVNVYLASLGKTYKGKVRQVGNFINPNNRSFGIEVTVPNPDNLLRPNQVAKLKIIDYTSKDAIVVPTNVVQEDGEGNKFVYTATDINGNKAIAKKCIVKLGQSSDNVTEILNGLSSKDKIITEGANTVSDGMKLNF